MKNETVYISTFLKENCKYKPAANRLFTALAANGVQYKLLDGTRDI